MRWSARRDGSSSIRASRIIDASVRRCAECGYHAHRSIPTITKEEGMTTAKRARLLAALIALPAGAGAQQSPTRPTRLIVAFPPGGSTDIIGRVIGQKLGERLGQQVVIDN